jgi:chromosome partitioning protein
MKKASRQIRLGIMSNAGGTGKTTLAVHLAYALCLKGYKTTIIELDPQGSLKVFCGLERPIPKQNLISVLDRDFSGDYPLIPVWEDYVTGLNVIQAGDPLYGYIHEIEKNPRAAYLLKDRLDDFPLNSDVIIFDNPAALEPMGVLCLAVASHILVPIKPEYKDIEGSANLVNWFYNKARDLRLDPRPEILGFVPSNSTVTSENLQEQVNNPGRRRTKGIAAHWDNLDLLSVALSQMKPEIPCFPPIRYSAEFINSSGSMVPLQVYRPGHPAVKDFEPIVTQLISILTCKI